MTLSTYLLSLITKSFKPVATKSVKSALKEADSVFSCLKLISLNFIGSIAPTAAVTSGIPFEK